MNRLNKRGMDSSKQASKLFIVSMTLLVLFFFLPVQAKLTIPDPTPQFYVNDYANVLTQETQDYIVSRNDDLFASHGAQIVIATVDFLDGYEIEDYAYKMFNEWGIGDKTKDNGVLVLLVIGEENYWVVQGKGLEKTLSSGTLKQILNEDMEPPFAIGDYDTGVIATFRSLYDVIEGVYGPVNETPSGWQEQPITPISSVGRVATMIGSFLVQLFVFLIIILVLMSFLRPRRYRRVWSPLFMPRPRYYRSSRHFRPGPGPRPGSGFGGGHSSGFGGGRSSGGGSRMGGGGSSRGGGAGRH